MVTPFNPYAGDDDELAAIAYADRLTPAEALMADRRMFGQRAVRGIENLGRTAIGLPAGPEVNRDEAARELRALAAKVRPGTAEFYEAATAILQKHGMPAEAEAMEKQRLALETGKGELSPVMKLQRARDLLTKRPDAASPAVQAAIAAVDREIAKAGTTPAGSQAAPHDFTKLLNDYEAALDAGKLDRAEYLKKALDAWLKQKEREGSDVAWARLALQKLIEERKASESSNKMAAVTAQEAKAGRGAIQGLDNEIQTADALARSPGLDGILGPQWGKLHIDAAAFMSGPAADAAAYYRPIEGQVFIRALQDLKATSKTGASGLGQLTEVEGGKIQAARAALNRQQTPAQFRVNLANYLRQLQSSRTILEHELTKLGVDIPAPLPPLPVGEPPAPKSTPKGGREEAALLRPAPAPAGPRKFKSTQVK